MDALHKAESLGQKLFGEAEEAREQIAPAILSLVQQFSSYSRIAILNHHYILKKIVCFVISSVQN